MVDSTSPSYGEKASYYSVVCLETGEVEWMDLEGNSNSGTSAAFLERLRQRHSGPLVVIWDNEPAHRREAVREYLRTPCPGLRLVNPRFHEGRLCRATARTEAPMRRWGWAGEEATGNLCLGTKALVKERVGNFLCGLSIGRRGQGPLPHRPAIKGRRLSARIPAQSPMYCKCTSHLSFGLAQSLPPGRTRPNPQANSYLQSTRVVSSSIRGPNAGLSPV